jgi:hypothetical protein
MKKSLIASLGLALTVFATQTAHADGSILCSSGFGEDGPTISMNRAAQPTGQVDELPLHEGQITPLETRSAGVLAFAFDSGIVHIKSRGGLSDKRLHGVLEVNVNDPARSLIRLQALSRVCEGISYFGHCDGSWEVLQADTHPVTFEMGCTIR